jgi:hypothetical protein
MAAQAVAHMDPQNAPQNPGDPCDTSNAAIRRGANDVISHVPGAVLGMDNGQAAIRFPGTFLETSETLKNAGYYSGIMAFNPFDHPGGLEFRTYGSPGFHFKLNYPTYDIGPFGRVGPQNNPTIATDLHIDCNNPVGAGWGDRIRHLRDFLRGHSIVERTFSRLPR